MITKRIFEAATLTTLLVFLILPQYVWGATLEVENIAGCKTNGYWTSPTKYCDPRVASANVRAGDTITIKKAVYIDTGLTILKDNITVLGNGATFKGNCTAFPQYCPSQWPGSIVYIFNAKGAKVSDLFFEWDPRAVIIANGVTDLVIERITAIWTGGSAISMKGTNMALRDSHFEFNGLGTLTSTGGKGISGEPVTIGGDGSTVTGNKFYNQTKSSLYFLDARKVYAADNHVKWACGPFYIGDGTKDSVFIDNLIEELAYIVDPATGQPGPCEIVAPLYNWNYGVSTGAGFLVAVGDTGTVPASCENSRNLIKGNVIRGKRPIGTKVSVNVWNADCTTNYGKPAKITDLYVADNIFDGIDTNPVLGPNWKSLVVIQDDAKTINSSMQLSMHLVNNIFQNAPVGITIAGVNKPGLMQGLTVTNNHFWQVSKPKSLTTLLLGKTTTGDPLFKNLQYYDYHVLPQSSVVGAGTPVCPPTVYGMPLGCLSFMGAAPDEGKYDQ